MARYSNEEIKAFKEKNNDITKIVYCPRCNTELKYHDMGNSYEIKCDTPNCLCFTVRGL